MDFTEKTIHTPTIIQNEKDILFYDNSFGYNSNINK